MNASPLLLRPKEFSQICNKFRFFYDCLAVSDIPEGALHVFLLEDYKEHKWSGTKIIIPLKILKDNPLWKDQVVIAMVHRDINIIKFHVGDESFIYDEIGEN